MLQNRGADMDIVQSLNSLPLARTYRLLRCNIKQSAYRTLALPHHTLRDSGGLSFEALYHFSTSFISALWSCTEFSSCLMHNTCKSLLFRCLKQGSLFVGFKWLNNFEIIVSRIYRFSSNFPFFQLVIREGLQ